MRSYLKKGGSLGYLVVTSLGYTVKYCLKIKRKKGEKERVRERKKERKEGKERKKGEERRKRRKEKAAVQ